MNEHRDASNRLTFDFGNLEADLYSKITESIVKRFRLESTGKKITNGYDIVFQDYKLESNLIGLEWDNWSGYIVIAKSPESEALAGKIAGYINVTFCS